MRNIIFTTIFTLIAASSAFAQAGRIEGTVRFNGNTPLHDATVSIAAVKVTTKTSEDGKYVLENVPVGRHTVIVHMEGFTDAVSIVDVTSGAATTVDFKLALAGLREQVTVTAGGTEQSTFEAFQTVTSLGSAAIREKSATSLGDVLDGESGVAKRSFGSGSSRPVIRGFDGDRVLVLEDGVRTGGIGSQSADHGETADPLTAERIEVVKGPATLLYGSNAIGGVVNVVGSYDTEAHKGFRGFLSGVGGSANREGSFSGGGEYGFGKWTARGSMSAQRAGDYNTPVGKIPNSAARSNSGSFGLGYYGDKAYATGSFTSTIRRYGVPFAGVFHGHHHEEEGLRLGEEEEEEVDIDLRLRNYSYTLKGGLKNLESPFVSGIQYSLNLANYRHKEIEVEEGLEEVGSTFDNKTFSYRSLFEQTRRNRLTGRFGFEGFSRDYNVVGEEQLIDGKVRQNSFSAFTLQEVNYDRVKFQFGGRIENNRYSAANPVYLDRSFTGFSAALGMNVGLWKGGAFVVNYANSHRAPALEELYNNGPHVGTLTYEIGNQNLKNERANGVDFALRHVSGRVRLNADFFAYRLNNFVYLQYQDEDGDGEVDIEDDLPLARFEQSDANYVGAEFSAEGSLTEMLGAYATADFIRARLTDDSNLPRIPPARLRLGLDVKYRGLSVRPELVFASKQDRLAPLETRTAGYGLFNVNGTYSVAQGAHLAHVLTFSLHNVTDRLYRNHLSYIKDLAPEMGRGVRVGYTVRFF
jgi:iron complex outermembrane receptor protein